MKRKEFKQKWNKLKQKWNELGKKFTSAEDKVTDWMLRQSLRKVSLIITIAIFGFITLKSLNREPTYGRTEATQCPPVGTVKTGYYGHCPDNFQKLILLKSSMKDPSSFKVIRTEQLQGGRLKVKYTATNGFGAKVTETKTLY